MRPQKRKPRENEEQTRRVNRLENLSSKFRSKTGLKNDFK